MTDKVATDGLTEQASANQVNNFVLRFANVNGTGSASANSLVTKVLFRMGLDIGPKNMFPSNIQGFPTWYEIRVSDQGHTARRGLVDIMVAMNPQTYSKDLAEVAPGGYYVYDSARYGGMPTERQDINYLPIPLTDLSQEFADPKARPMLKNIIYVGALSALMQLDPAVVKGLITELYGKKPKLLAANFQAWQLGWDYAQKNFNCPLAVRVSTRTRQADRILIDGNQALALGCLYGGATVCSWYPITPSTSVVDHFQAYCESYRQTPDGFNNYAIIQAEDEIAAAGMVLGASWAGARAFTATSGPGMSLMAEFIGYAYYAEIPAVFMNIQRVGPATGMPTRTQQSDLIAMAYLSHGDTKHVLLWPGNPNECFEFGALAFDLADQLQTPVILMSDIELGMNEFMADPLSWPKERSYQRGKVLSGDDLDKLQRQWFRYEDVDGDGICYRTLPGAHASKGANLTRGSGHDRYGRYTEDGALYADNMDRLQRKFVSAKAYMPKPLLTERDSKNRIGLIYLGVLHETVRETLEDLSKEGLAINDLRLRGFPFSGEVGAFVNRHQSVIVLDQNRDGQLRTLLLAEEDLPPEKLLGIRSYDGLPLTAFALKQLILGVVGTNK